MIIAFSFDYITYSEPDSDSDSGAVVYDMLWLRRLLCLTAYSCGRAGADVAGGEAQGVARVAV